MTATIHVQRTPDGYTDSLRAYKVLVDGQVQGRLKRGESVDVQVAPGVHTVRMAVDWCRSRQHTVEVADGGTAVLEAAPRSALVSFLYGFFAFRDYIRLDRL
jgi:hypothetical protein